MAETATTTKDAETKATGTKRARSKEEASQLPEGLHYVKKGETSDGAVFGQVLPREDKSGPSEAALKAGDAYRKGRSKCPACGLFDGVREGAQQCDSCGAHVGKSK